MTLSLDSNRVSLICVVFAADGLPSFRAKGALVPVPVDDPAFHSHDTGEAIDLLPPVDPPPLSPSDCLVGVPVNTVPVGGHLSLFVAQTTLLFSLKPLYYFSSPPGFSDFSSSQFSGGVTGSHRTPQGSEGSPSYLQRNPRVDSEESYRPNRQFSVTLPFSYFCDSQENRGSSS